MQHTFRASQEDEQILNALCGYLERNLAEVVRHSLRLTARHYGLIAERKKPVLEIDFKEVIADEAPAKQP